MQVTSTDFEIPCLYATTSHKPVSNPLMFQLPAPQPHAPDTRGDAAARGAGCKRVLQPHAALRQAEPHHHTPDAALGQLLDYTFLASPGVNHASF